MVECDKVPLVERSYPMRLDEASVRVRDVFFLCLARYTTGENGRRVKAKQTNRNQWYLA